MFKTPLIIGAGTGWSATSPLHLTLQCANKCSHTGILKEDHLLSHVYSQDAWEWRKPTSKFAQLSFFHVQKQLIRNLNDFQRSVKGLQFVLG